MMHLHQFPGWYDAAGTCDGPEACRPKEMTLTHEIFFWKMKRLRQFKFSVMQSHQIMRRMMRMHQMEDGGGASVWAWVALVAAAAAFFLSISGCGGATHACRGDDECGDGVCVNGACRPLASPDLASALPATDGGVIDLAQPVPAQDGALALDAIASACTFNSDGVIDRSEEPFLVGLGALFAVNPAGSTTPVNETASNGTWDFSAVVTNETKVFDQILSPSGQWWSSDFPDATYAEKLEDGQSILGVYRVTSDRLELLGLVSEQSGLQQTELTYSTPIPLLEFPIHKDDHFTAQSNLTGMLNGFPGFIAQDSYDITVDARGTTRVPAGSFDTLRIRMSYTQTVNFVPTTRITYLHLAECYGAVARVRSQDNETSTDFTQAAEYRRLATQ